MVKIGRTKYFIINLRYTIIQNFQISQRSFLLLVKTTLLSSSEKMLFPPHRFSWVQESLCRGAWPSARNQEFLSGLELKSILSLTPKPLQEEWAKEQGIQLLHIKVEEPKEEGGAPDSTSSRSGSDLSKSHTDITDID
jgi:hypothetical protein